MPCGDSTYVSGTYLATIRFDFDSAAYDLGTTDDGFEIEITHSVADITTDGGGDTVVNGIYRGGNCFVNTTFLEFHELGVQRLRRAYSNMVNLTGAEGTIGTIGCTVRDQYAFELLLTRQSPANATNSFLYYKFADCIMDPNFPVRWSLQSRLWTMPMRFRSYPVTISNVDYLYQAYDS